MNNKNIQRHKILFYIGDLGGGGAERVMLNLLCHLDRNKYQLSLMLQEHKGEYLNLVPDDVQIIDLSWKKGKIHYFQRINQLYQVIKIVKPDLIVSFRTGANIALSRAKLFTRFKSKIILREGNNLSLNFLSLVKFPWVVLKKIELRLLFSIADKIITISEGIKDDLVANFNLKKTLFYTISNPVDITSIVNHSKDQIPEIDQIKGVKTIVAIGRFFPQKAYFDMIKVFRIIRTAIPSKLIILGQGPQEEAIREQVKIMKLEHDVLMPGFVDNPYAYLKYADVYLSTSHWEGFHLTVAEAMACGVPPVATDCNYGPREIIHDGIDGILVPVGDIEAIANGVIQLLQDEDYRQQLSDKAKIRAKDFDVSVIIKEYERIFDETMMDEA